MAVIQNHIQHYRKKRKMSQVELIKKLAEWRYNNEGPQPVVTTTVGLSKLENNHCQPSESNANGISAILGVPKKTLFIYGELKKGRKKQGRPRREDYIQIK